MESAPLPPRTKAAPRLASVIPFCQKSGAVVVKPTYAEVFNAEESPLLHYAYGIVGQRETAEDLVQEAFLRLYAHWEQVDQPRAWLFRCTRNLAFSHLRDHRREIPLATQDWESSQPNPAQALGKLEAIGTLQLLICELDEDEQALIAMKYRDALKYEQISKKTGLSVSNVGYKLHHALKSLAASLQRLGVESADG